MELGKPIIGFTRSRVRTGDDIDLKHCSALSNDLGFDVIRRRIIGQPVLCNVRVRFRNERLCRGSG